MQHVYDKMTEEGKIGAFEIRDGRKQAKPFAEYPKRVTNAKGARVTVHNLTEEMDAVGPMAVEQAKNDPLANEKLALEAERAKLAEARAELESNTVKIRTKLDEFEHPGVAKPEPVKAPEPATVKPVESIVTDTSIEKPDEKISLK